MVDNKPFLVATPEFGLIDHINALDRRIGQLEMRLGIDEAQGSGYTRGWDKGFAGEGDPYGIGSEYVSTSANPDAHIPTQAEADAIAAQPD